MGRLFLALILFIGYSGNSVAGFILSVDSNVPLLPDTVNQAVDVFLTSDSALDPAIKGMVFKVYIGNNKEHVGDANQGVFNSGFLNGVQLTGASYFWDLGPGSVASAPPVSLRSVAEPSVNFNSGSQFVGLNTTVKIATLHIDTTGIFSGTYALSLNDPFRLDDRQNFGPTDLIFDTLGAPINNISFTNGSYTITAVPEPSALLLVAVGTGIVAIRRRVATRRNSQLAA